MFNFFRNELMLILKTNSGTAKSQMSTARVWYELPVVVLKLARVKICISIATNKFAQKTEHKI